VTFQQEEYADLRGRERERAVLLHYHIGTSWCIRANRVVLIVRILFPKWTRNTSYLSLVTGHDVQAVSNPF
jgi:hypothetical protein